MAARAEGPSEERQRPGLIIGLLGPLGGHVQVCS